MKNGKKNGNGKPAAPSSTGAKQPPEAHLVPYRWKPGQSGNPMGRQAGTRNKIQEQFLKDFLEAWLAFGRPALMAAAWTKPADFVKVAAMLLPKEVDATITTINADRMSDDQLATIAAGSSAAAADAEEDAAGLH